MPAFPPVHPSPSWAKGKTWDRDARLTFESPLRFTLKRNCDSHESGWNESTGILALVLRVRQFHKLLVEFLQLSIFPGGFDGVHGRSIEGFKQLYKLRRGFVGRGEVVRVPAHGNLLLRHSSLAKAVDDVILQTPGHRTD